MAPLPDGARLTPQRRAVVELVESWTGAFSAADLHERARASDRRIGLATVYRTLELLRAAGAVRVLNVGGRPAYVRCPDDHHHHLVCTTCGAVEDTELCAAPPPEELAARHGFTVVAHELDIYGICRRCG